MEGFDGVDSHTLQGGVPGVLGVGETGVVDSGDC